VTRWATFDCYGTLIDWNAGIGAVLERLYGAEQAPRLLRRYHELEPEVQAERYRSYAEVLTLTLERLANEVGYGIPEGESGVLPHSLPSGRRSRRRPTRWPSCGGAGGASRSSPTSTAP
jgi:2-haloacid dehalogenase